MHNIRYLLKYTPNQLTDQAISTKHLTILSHQINNIPYGQALRLKRICTEETDLDQAIQNLKESFEKRGYKETQLEEQFKNIQTCEQKGPACIQGKQSRQYNQIHYKIQSKSPRRAQSHP